MLNILVVLMILIFLKPNSKFRVSHKQNGLKSTPKKSNKQQEVVRNE
jgi:hypothetical protein